MMNRKNLYRKAVCVLLLLILVLSGCGGTGAKGVQQTGHSSDVSETSPDAGMNTETTAGISTSDAEEQSRLQVVTTFFPQYDFARQITGDSADVTMLLKPGEEVHSYEPTPQDIKTIQNSDLFIYVGGENDVWVENILDSVKDDWSTGERVAYEYVQLVLEEVELYYHPKHVIFDKKLIPI